MISENLAKLVSNLKKDNVDFFRQNWSMIDSDIEPNFLSLCLEERAFKTFEFAISQGLRNIRSIVFANAVRNQDEKILQYIKTYGLFELEGTRGTDLFNIAVNNNDEKVISYLWDKVHIAPDILNYAIYSQNKELIQKLIDKNFLFTLKDSDNNPLVIAMLNYLNHDIVYTILKSSEHTENMIRQCQDYLQEPEKSIFNSIIKNFK